MTGLIMEPIRTRALRRGITRLCHFTPSRNLAHIASDRQGILATRHLETDERSVLNPTDRERLDGHPDHVCCSIQYPNAWYFRTARKKEQLFRDWVVLLIESHYLWRRGTKFCPRNAAAARGQLVGEGTQAFNALFAEVVEGVQRYQRGPNRPDFLPTDEQAEVLVPDRILRNDVQGVAVRDDTQAANEVARMEQLGVDVPRFVVVPEFFDAYRLSGMLRTGRIPNEIEYQRGEAHD